MTFILFIGGIGVLLYRVTTPEDRVRYLKIALANWNHLKAAATKPRPELDQFDAALRARTSRLLLTPASVAVMVAIWAAMFWSRGGDEATHVLSWGGSIGTRTTNGEWWRLMTSMFVHGSVVMLALNGAAIYQVGGVLERLAGRGTVAAVFVLSGILAAIASIASQPVTVTAGASGGLFGLYGLMIAAVVMSRRPSSEVPEEFRIAIPPIAIRRIATVAVGMLLVNAISGSLTFAAELAALATGLTGGVVLMRGIAECVPPAQRLAATTAGGLLLAILTAWPLNGISDVRPEIARLVATEDRTAAAYVAELERLKKGKTTADGVANVIDAKISPELEDVDARLKALKKVPPEHQAMLNDAQEYLRLRAESWRLRAASLRAAARSPAQRKAASDGDDRAAGAKWRTRVEAQFRSTRAAIGKAEAVERSSLEVFAKLKAAV